MHRMSLFAILMLAIAPYEARAQFQAVQQPVVRQFGVGTSVSVPDRGRVHLGGVSKGATGRKTYGPVRSGTSTGYEYSNASQSASVYIFDFDSMDKELLESANRDSNTRAFASRGDQTKIQSRAEKAWQSRQSRKRP